MADPALPIHSPITEAAPRVGGRKPRLSPSLLADMIGSRLRDHAAVRLDVVRHRMSPLNADDPVAHAPDAAGHAWNVRGFNSGALTEANSSRTFRAVVDGLRDECDLDAIHADRSPVPRSSRS